STPAPRSLRRPRWQSGKRISEAWRKEDEESYHRHARGRFLGRAPASIIPAASCRKMDTRASASCLRRSEAASASRTAGRPISGMTIARVRAPTPRLIRRGPAGGWAERSILPVFFPVVVEGLVDPIEEILAPGGGRKFRRPA